MIFLMENANYEIEFDYNNDTTEDLDSIKNQIFNNQARLKNLKKKLNQNDFIYPTNYIFEFIEQSYEIMELTDKNQQLNGKLSEVSFSCYFVTLRW